MKRGIFNSKQLKKLDKEETERIRRERAKSKRLQLMCNHIDTNGKDQLKPNGNGTLKCKLCKAVIIANPDIINKDAVREAMEIVYSAVAIVRHELSLTEKYDSKLSNATIDLSEVPDLLDDMEKELAEEDRRKKENRRNRHNNGRKKGTRTRIRY